MIRFALIYYFTIIYRVIRLFFHSKLTGDTNFLSTPVKTVHRILAQPSVGSYTTFIDIGCGEGLIGYFVRFFEKKTVIMHDIQHHFVIFINLLKRLFFISKLTCTREMLGSYPIDSVFLCVWTSWSIDNRQTVISNLTSMVPKGAMLITVSHGIIHPAFLEVDKIDETFAWGRAKVYYYRHA